MIERMTSKYEKELNDFLYEHILIKEYFVAWVPETYNEIAALEKKNFVLCIENGKIVGCLGLYISYEQKVARLLGPMIEIEYFNQYVDELYCQCLQNLPQDMVELKIAFYEENRLCKNWCEKNGFELYNAETTMIFNKETYVGQVTPSAIVLRPFESQYKKGLELVHPKGVFFTVDEMCNRLSENNHLLLAIKEDEVAGYVYYEKSEDNIIGEIQLLHVRNDFRGLGYGTALLDRAISDLISKNVEQILISVRVANHGAQSLYRRVGFIDKDTVYAYRKSIEV